MISPRCVAPACCGFGLSAGLLAQRVFGNVPRGALRMDSQQQARWRQDWYGLGGVFTQWLILKRAVTIRRKPSNTSAI